MAAGVFIHGSFNPIHNDHIDSIVKVKEMIEQKSIHNECKQKNIIGIMVPTSKFFLDHKKDLNSAIHNGRKTRFTDKGIEESGIEPLVVTGKKGTVIVSDTSYVHRGSVINKGKRYSLTSYLQKETEIYKMEKKYNEWYVPKRVK